MSGALSREQRRQMLVEALRRHKTWGDAYIAERLRAEHLADCITRAKNKLVGEDYVSSLQILRDEASG